MAVAVPEVVSYMKKELGTYYSTEAFPDPYRYINSAINYVYNYKDWQFLRKTATVVYTTPEIEVSIPFNLKTYYISSGEESELEILNAEDWFKWDEWACVTWDKFKARYASTFNILYTPSYTKVDANSATIDLPDNFLDILQTISVHFAFKDVRDYDSANQALAFWKAMLDNIAERNTNSRPRKKRRTWSRHNIF